MNFNLQKIANPYTIFGVAWLFCLLLYSFNWAGIFPPISSPLAIFLTGLIVVFLCTGFFYKYIKPTPPAVPVLLNYKVLLMVNAFVWLITFMYSGLPILNGLRDDDFGIPLVKNFATSFNNFLSVYCFYLFLVTGKKRFILYTVACLSIFILVISRGNIMMSMSTMFFVWMNIKSPKLTLKKTVSIIAVVLSIFYLFGVAGNYRSIKDLASYNPKFESTYNSEIILQIGDASESFKNSIIPNEYFWSYVYITSPLSNLQYNLNTESPAFTSKGVAVLAVNELMFDAISKKINTPLNLVPKPPNLIVETLTVCTTLVGSYIDAGWLGMSLFIFVFWMFPIIYTFSIQKAPLGVLGVSTMCTIYLFSIFDNMFILSGLMFQLFYPLLFMISLKPARNEVNIEAK